jgi:hypothetical protein
MQNIPAHFSHNAKCEISDGERWTAQALNLHPQDVHNFIDWHMAIITDPTNAGREAACKNSLREALEGK